MISVGSGLNWSGLVGGLTQTPAPDHSLRYRPEEAHSVMGSQMWTKSSTPLPPGRHLTHVSDVSPMCPRCVPDVFTSCPRCVLNVSPTCP